jgi:hypothetical protein
MFDLLNDDNFLEDKFNYTNNVFSDFNIKDLPSNNDIDFEPINHINNTLLLNNNNNNNNNNNKNINFSKIYLFLSDNNIKLPFETTKGFFYIYLQHNDVSTLSERDMLQNFLKMVKFYNQFNKRKIPVYNNSKQNKIGKIEEKSSEMDTNFNQHNSISKSMQFQNQQYLTKKKF